MKNIILILIILFSVSSFAKNSETISTVSTRLGPEWKLLGSMQSHYSGKATCLSKFNEIKSYFYNDQGVPGRTLLPLPEFLSYYTYRYGGLSEQNPYLSYEKVESRCSEVAYVVATDLPSDWKNSRTLVLQLYCKQRTYSELVLLSLYKTCVKEPKQECFQPNILENLNNLKPLQSNDDLTNCSRR